MAQNSAGDDNFVDSYTDDFLEIDNFQSSPVQPIDETIAMTASSSSSRTEAIDLVEMGFSDEIFATLFDMGFSIEMISRAIRETGPNADTSAIIDTISKYSSDCEAGSSKSKAIDHFLSMGFDEEKVIKAIHEHGEENMEEIANALLSCVEAEKLPVLEGADVIELSDNYSDVSLSDDDDKDPHSSNENENHIRSLVSMGFSRIEASLAVERCGENVEVAELTDFICASHMAREFTEIHTDPEEQKPTHDVKKRRLESKRKPRSSGDDNLVRLPNPMIGFGLPNEPGLITHRSLPELARGPPYFYYENVACAPKGVWDVISTHLYEITPEFVDSKYFCAAARKRGYIHNLPINQRFQLQPPPKYTIQEAFPLTEKWWPIWDQRTQLNCILTSIGSAKLTNRIHKALQSHSGEIEPPTHVKSFVIDQCRRYNLVWVGKNKVAPLEPDEIEYILGFPKNHTRGGGVSDRYKSLGNSFQVDTVAYHLSVLKPIFPSGLNVLSLFTGIGGGEVALHRLQIPMNLVVSVEISEVNRNVLKDFWEQTNQTGVLIEISDVRHLTDEKIEELMKKYGGFDLVIGGSPCNNLAGSNRVSRVGLEGDQSILFFEYCRILEVVRSRMRRS